MPFDRDHALDEQAPSTRRSGRRGARLRRGWLVAGAVGIPALAFVLWWFQPQALLFDNVLDDSFPVGPSADRVDPDSGDAEPGAAPDGDAPSDHAEPSTNGPDLFVYLTVAGAADDDDAVGAAFVDLGALTGNIGNQNYLIPDHVDLDRYRSVAIWCRRFTTSFGVADLSTR